MYHRMDEWKEDLWNLAGIPTPPNDHETNETLVFGYLVAWFLGEVSRQRGLYYNSDAKLVSLSLRLLQYAIQERKKAIIAHFHEWQAGLAIPLCRKRRIDVTTIFTTHATLLGRYLW